MARLPVPGSDDGAWGDVLNTYLLVGHDASGNNIGVVDSLSVASANGFAGSSSGGSTPALTLSTTVTGILSGNGTAVSAASTTGSGAVVLASAPALVTPTLGVATATSVNKMAITAPATSSTLAVADGKTFTASNTITLSGTDSVSMNVSNTKIATIGGFFDGGGSAISNGSTAYVNCPFAGTITGYSIMADTGTCTIKTWKIATGTAIPTVSNSISTSGVSLSSNTAIRSTTLSDFTSTTVAANDMFGFAITAIASATKISFQLEITKS